MKFGRNIILPLVLCLLSSCVPGEESLDMLSDRVWQRAKVQFGILERGIPDSLTARSLNADGTLNSAPATGWCSGFFPGSLWYLYECTGDGEVREMAERQTHRLDGAAARVLNHDTGFMFWCSFGNAWRITGDRSYLAEVRDAAENLAGRFVPAAGVTMSWRPDPEKDWQCPVIIDNMMNLELLEESARLFGIPEYSEIAESHASVTMRNHFRDDFSSFHLVDYDPVTGTVRRKMTVQGYADGSSWARGQGWGLYAFTMMYRETGRPEFLAHAEKIAGYILGRGFPEDGIPYWDFDAPDIPDAPRDVSAGALMASAFLELSLLTESEDRALIYRETAEHQIRSLASERYLADEGTNGGFLLKHSVGNYPGGVEVDAPLVYADYYFLEALQRLSRMPRRRFSAHRGLQPFGPENSIASMKAAAEHKLWAIETDFRQSADGEIVCIHDTTLDRTTDGSGNVRDYTLAELRLLRVQPVNSESTYIRYGYGSLSDKDRAIPTMDEYLSICHDGGCVAFIELKEDDGVIEKMNTAIRRHGMTGRCVISSSSRELLRAYRRSGGKEQIHLIFGTPDDIDHLAADGNAAVAFDYQNLDAPVNFVYGGHVYGSLREVVDLCHSKGIKVCFRAVDNQLDALKSLDLNIDYLPTNNIWK